MREFLLVDCETSDIFETPVHVVEVAAVRWSLDHLAVRESLATVITAPKPPASVTGIPEGMLEGAPDLDSTMADLAAMAEGCEAVLAHNAEFDRGHLGRFLPLPWICTYQRMRWPRQSSGNRLVDVALAHGVAVGRLHRALDDCLLMAAVLERVAELQDAASVLSGGNEPTLDEMLTRAAQPLHHVEALVEFPGTEAKAAGFAWKPNPGKMWHGYRFEDELAALPFRTRPLGIVEPPVGAWGLTK